MKILNDSQRQLEIKKWEEWYNLTKYELKNTKERFEKIEEKMTRYSVLVSFIIGAWAIKLDSFIQFWKKADSCWDIYFVTFFISLVVASFISLFLYVISLEFETFFGTPINPESLKVFQENNYIDSIYAMSDSNIKAVNNNKKIIEKKLQIAHFAYRFTLATIMLTALCVITYSIGMFSPYDNDGSSPNSSIGSSEQLTNQDVIPNFDITGPDPQRLEKSFSESELQQR